MPQDSFILASASKSRQALLANAGLNFDIQPADVDEPAIKQAFSKNNADANPADIALILASTKAVVISELNPDKLVIGADQVLVLETTRMSKPASMDAARDHLLRLRDKTHTLESAVSCAKAGKIIWTYSDSAHMTMRNFTPEFLGQYLADVGDDVLTSVGGYKLEGRGIQLFERIEGNYFTILGLPLLPLLTFLRDQSVVAN